MPAGSAEPVEDCAKKHPRTAKELSCGDDVSLLKATSEPLVHTRNDRQDDSDLRCPFAMLASVVWTLAANQSRLPRR